MALEGAPSQPILDYEAIAPCNKSNGSLGLMARGASPPRTATPQIIK